MAFVKYPNDRKETLGVIASMILGLALFPSAIRLILEYINRPIPDAVTSFEDVLSHKIVRAPLFVGALYPIADLVLNRANDVEDSSLTQDGPIVVVDFQAKNLPRISLVKIYQYAPFAIALLGICWGLYNLPIATSLTIVVTLIPLLFHLLFRTTIDTLEDCLVYWYGHETSKSKAEQQAKKILQLQSAIEYYDHNLHLQACSTRHARERFKYYSNLWREQLASRQQDWNKKEAELESRIAHLREKLSIRMALAEELEGTRALIHDLLATRKHIDDFAALREESRTTLLQTREQYTALLRHERSDHDAAVAKLKRQHESYVAQLLQQNEETKGLFQTLLRKGWEAQEGRERCWRQEWQVQRLRAGLEEQRHARKDLQIREGEVRLRWFQRVVGERDAEIEGLKGRLGEMEGVVAELRAGKEECERRLEVVRGREEEGMECGCGHDVGMGLAMELGMEDAERWSGDGRDESESEEDWWAEEDMISGSLLFDYDADAETISLTSSSEESFELLNDSSSEI